MPGCNKALYEGRGVKGRSPSWNTRRFSRERLREHLEETRRKFTRSKGDALLYDAWKVAKAALRRGIKKSQLQCWKDLIGEVEKDPWGLAFKLGTKRLAIRRKTPDLDDPDRVEYIVGSLFPHVEPLQRQEGRSCVVQRPAWSGAKNSLFSKN